MKDNDERFVTPMEPSVVASKMLLPDGYTHDHVFRFDPTLGEGKTDTWQEQHPVMYIKAPCHSHDSVKAIVDMLKSKTNRHSGHDTPPPTPADWQQQKDRMQKELLEKDVVIAEKDKVIDDLRETLKNVRLEKKRKSDRKHKQANRAVSTANEKSAELAVYEKNSVLWEQINNLIASAGGLSRLTIFSNKWHKNHPEAATVLFGYRNWDETKQYLRDYFSDELDTEIEPAPIVPSDVGEELRMPPLLEMEKCLLCRMFFHLCDKQKFLALIIDRHRTTVGNIIKEWAPKWGEVGEDISLLDVTEDYLIKEEPDKIAELFLQRIVFNDGKDWKVGSKHNDNVTSKLMYSTKCDCDGGRGESWTTAAGLGFEHSPIVAAHLSENSLQRMMGSLGRATADVKSWEDVGKQPKYQPTLSERHWTALDDMLTAKDVRLVTSAKGVEDMIEDICAYEGAGAVHDDVLGSAKATAKELLGLEDMNEESDSDADDDDGGAGSTKSPVFGGMEEVKKWVSKVKTLNAVEEKHKSQHGNKKKMAPLLSPERLKELFHKALLRGPNSSGWRKLRQLERHERLHRSYESGKLHKCLLSYFLLVATGDRHKLLAWMGSSMVPEVEKPSPEELPEIYLRLAKIPPSFRVGTDKNFYGTDRDYPWFNHVVAPTKLREMKGYRKTPWHIRRDKPLCSARFSSETYFFRVDNDDVLKDVIPYWIIPILPHAHALAHGEANVCMPFRLPGCNSIVGDDYWENKKQYTRKDPNKRATNVGVEGEVNQSSEVSDIEMESLESSGASEMVTADSVVQDELATSYEMMADINMMEDEPATCASCESSGWGSLLPCLRCNRWFHEDCHPINNCVRNPYNKKSRNA